MPSVSNGLAVRDGSGDTVAGVQHCRATFPVVVAMAIHPAFLWSAGGLSFSVTLLFENKAANPLGQ
jgi:hypothetical protein